MKDERIDVFALRVPRWKTWTKQSLLWLYSYGLLSRSATQRAIDYLGLRLA